MAQPLKKLIIDTSGSYEDVLAILFALADFDSQEVHLVTVTNPGGQVAEGVRNIISMFENLKAEMEWRQQERRRIGYASLYRVKPVIAIGASHPLSDDGQSATSDAGSQLRSEEIWQTVDTQNAGPSSAENKIFFRSTVPAHEEMLRVLRENEPGTVSIIALAPLTTLALAAAADTETVFRAQEVVVVGGSMNASNYALLAAESNTYPDPLAAAKVFATTTPLPGPATLYKNDYPHYQPTKLFVLLFPLESTNKFFLTQRDLHDGIPGSPLTKWLVTVLEPNFGRSETAGKARFRAPVAMWYAKTPYDWEWVRSYPEDIRVELTGESKGLCIIDKTNVKDEKKSMYEKGRWIDEYRGTRLQVVSNDCQDVYDTTLWGAILRAASLAKEDE